MFGSNMTSSTVKNHKEKNDMGKKYTPRVKKSRGRASRRGANPLIWVGGVLAIVVLLAAITRLK